MNYPKIYLAIDNCFATKRWTRPQSWSKIISECGISYVESSADTECDMLYHSKDYLTDWQNITQKCANEHGLCVASVYTGHGTYSTLGLTHTDERCRKRFLKEWLYPHIENAANFGAIAGFFCHAFDTSVLQSADKYQKYVEILISQLQEVAKHCKKNGVIPSLEQMYTPNQYPWRITDAEYLIKSVSVEAPLYLTIDTGHQCGQKQFLMPTEATILSAIENKTSVYIGCDEAYRVLDAARNGNIPKQKAVADILSIASTTPHLFSKEEDSDTWEWIRRIGRYSPIIHLQQTDNNSSSHKDFSEKNNAAGIITGEKLITALYESYSKAPEADMPPAVDKIYFTLEMFYPTAEKNFNIVNSIKTSVAYWRTFIPSDGMSLDELYRNLK